MIDIEKNTQPILIVICLTIVMMTIKPIHVEENEIIKKLTI